jgi:hypothetical protein
MNHCYCRCWITKVQGHVSQAFYRSYMRFLLSELHRVARQPTHTCALKFPFLPSVNRTCAGWSYYSCDSVRLSIKLRPLTCWLSIPQWHEWICSCSGMNNTDREKPVPVPLCPAHIPDRLTWAQTRAHMVGSRQMTAWATHGCQL